MVGETGDYYLFLFLFYDHYYFFGPLALAPEQQQEQQLSGLLPPQAPQSVLLVVLLVLLVPHRHRFPSLSGGGGTSIHTMLQSCTARAFLILSHSLSPLASPLPVSSPLLSFSCSPAHPLLSSARIGSLTFSCSVCLSSVCCLLVEHQMELCCPLCHSAGSSRGSGGSLCSAALVQQCSILSFWLILSYCVAPTLYSSTLHTLATINLFPSLPLSPSLSR